MTAGPRETPRYLAKRETILDAASTLINTRGAAGMTLAAVAEAVGLNTASVTYYFKRRDDLAIACYNRALDQIERMVDAGALEPDPRARVRRFLALHIDQLRRARAGQAPPITLLSDIRTMDDPVRVELVRRYIRSLRRLRGYFGPDRDAAHKRLLIARVHVLIETIFWLPAWIDGYAIEDFDRVEARMMEIFDGGVAAGPVSSHGAGRVLDLDAGADPASAAQTRFLAVATRLINERGYRGASVERIAAELNVTKGSFYHHLEAKDDLVLACFDRSFDTIARAQRLANAAGQTHWQRLKIAVTTLLDLQFSDRGSLLRSSALPALPTEFRARVIAGNDRVARRFAGMIIDGISEGSMRPVDPLIASQMVLTMLNSAYELRVWARQMPAPEAFRLYASTLATGLFAQPG